MLLLAQMTIVILLYKLFLARRVRVRETVNSELFSQITLIINEINRCPNRDLQEGHREGS